MKIIITLILTLSLTIAISAQDSTYTKYLKFAPTDSMEDYGSTVDIEGDWIMIGAEDAPVNNIESGTVYVYKNVNGSIQFVKKLYPSDGGALTRYGNSISIENSTMIIGAWGKGVSAGGTFYPAAGKAYIYEQNEGGTDDWGEVKDLVSPSIDGSEYFGYSVDIGDNVAAVGAYNNDDIANNSGKVYLYGREIGGTGNWGFIKSITLAGAGANYNFGIWVEVSDNYLAVTSRDFNFEGKVYIYHKDEGGADNWGLKKTLVSPIPGTSRIYGDETSLDGDNILVSAHRDINSNFSNTGRAYLYSKDQGGTDNWGLVHTFEPDEISAGQEFGLTVDLNGDHLVIGAEEDDEVATNAGAAYVYRRNQGGANNWGLINKILDCDNTGNDDFGTAVAIKGTQVIVGADDHDALGDNSGAAYLYMLSPDQLSVDNSAIGSSSNLIFPAGLNLTSDAQITESGKTVRFQSQQDIGLEPSFSVNPMTTLECIVESCGE